MVYLKNNYKRAPRSRRGARSERPSAPLLMAPVSLNSFSAGVRGLSSTVVSCRVCTLTQVQTQGACSSADWLLSLSTEMDAAVLSDRPEGAPLCRGVCHTSQYDQTMSHPSYCRREPCRRCTRRRHVAGLLGIATLFSKAVVSISTAPHAGTHSFLLVNTGDCSSVSSLLRWASGVA